MSEHSGLPTPSETADRHDGGVDWPPDRFTRAVLASPAAATATPAAHSYADDSNMEAFDAMPPYALRGEAETDLARFTGAVGPAGRATPEEHPEPTAP